MRGKNQPTRTEIESAVESALNRSNNFNKTIMLMSYHGYDVKRPHNSNEAAKTVLRIVVLRLTNFAYDAIEPTGGWYTGDDGATDGRQHPSDQSLENRA